MLQVYFNIQDKNIPKKLDKNLLHLQLLKHKPIILENHLTLKDLNLMAQKYLKLNMIIV